MPITRSSSGQAAQQAPPPPAGGKLRSALAPLAVAAARARARPLRGLLVALGVAVATALLAVVLGGSVVTGEQTLRHSLAQLSPADRALRVNWLGLPPNGGYAGIDRRAVSTLGDLGARDPVRTTLFRETSVGGLLLELSAVDDAGRWVRITSGRAPRSCTPARCEVLQVGGDAFRRADSPGLHLVRVGSGVLRSSLPFGSDAASAAVADQHSGRGAHAKAPFLVAGSVRQLADLPALSLIYRTYGWAGALAPGAVHAWTIDDLLAREARATSGLGAASDLFRLTAPDRTLLDAKAAGDTSARRLLLVGGEAAALLLAFILLAAGSLRRDLTAEWRRLERRGARRGQLYAFALLDLGWPAFAGVVLGGLAGLVTIWIVAGAADVPAGDVLRHSLVGLHGVELLVGCWLVATALLLVAARWPAPSAGRRRGLQAGDLVALAAIGALVLAAARGRSSAGQLGADGADPLLPLLPLLISLAAGILVARLIGPALRAGERAARGGPATVRLALLALARQPGRAALTAAFLAVSFGLALFADSYRETLSQGQRDQAAFAVPLAATVQDGGALVLPLQAAPLSRYQQLAGGTTALPILRRTATLASSGTQASTITVLGVPSSGLRLIHRWRAGDANASLATISSRLHEPDPSAGLPVLPAGTRTLVIPASRRGDDVALSLLVETPARVAALPLREGPGGELRATVPSDLAGGRVQSLRAGLVRSHLHEDSTAETTSGTLTLDGLYAVGASGTRHLLTRFAGWQGQNGLTPSSAGVTYRLGPGAFGVLRRSLPTDSAPLPVLASPDVAAAADANGRLTLSFDGGTLQARVAAVADRFPTVDSGGYVVADEPALAAALNAQQPGTGTPGELWLEPHDPARTAELDAALARQPFDVLVRSSRSGIEDGLRADPLSHGVLVTLGGAAALALALALAGLLLAVASDLRDERAELYDLEAQGVEPSTLRRELRLRAAILGGAGLLCGLVVGIVLSRSVVDLVLVSANAGAPQPPLVEATRWLAVAGAAVLFAVLASVGVLAITHVAFRRQIPSRPIGSPP